MPPMIAGNTANPESQNPFKAIMMTRGETSRIPATLQNVFIAASRGIEIIKPPPNGVASRVFRPRFLSSRPKFMVKRNSSGTSIVEKEPSSSQVSGQRLPSATSNQSLNDPSPVSLKTSITHHVSPQSYYTSLLQTRGYSTTTYRSLATSYYNKPTSFQLLSYGPALVEAINSGNVDLLSQLLAVGLSPNACNAHGESIVHLACRSGKKDCLQVLLDHGGSVQVADAYGRTPMHDVCFSREPTMFEIVDIILKQDRRLLNVEDSKGALPLSYLHAEQWTPWTKYLMSRKDKFWPDRNVPKQGREADPPQALEAPNTRPFPNAKDALPEDLLRMVANKRMDHTEAALWKDGLNNCSSSRPNAPSNKRIDDMEAAPWKECMNGGCSDSNYSTDDSSSTSDDDHWDCEGEDEDEDTEKKQVCDDDKEDSTDFSSFDENELNDILGCLTKGKTIDWSPACSSHKKFLR